MAGDHCDKETHHWEVTVGCDGCERERTLFITRPCGANCYDDRLGSYEDKFLGCIICRTEKQMYWYCTKNWFDSENRYDHEVCGYTYYKVTNRDKS